MVLWATAARVFVACVCANAIGAAVAMMAAQTAIRVVLDIFPPDLNPDVPPTHRLAPWFLPGSIALSMFQITCKTYNRMMIGIGIPNSQSNTPLPIVHSFTLLARTRKQASENGARLLHN